MYCALRLPCAALCCLVLCRVVQSTAFSQIPRAACWVNLLFCHCSEFLLAVLNVTLLASRLCAKMPYAKRRSLSPFFAFAMQRNRCNSAINSQSSCFCILSKAFLMVLILSPPDCSRLVARLHVLIFVIRKYKKHKQLNLNLNENHLFIQGLKLCSLVGEWQLHFQVLLFARKRPCTVELNQHFRARNLAELACRSSF